MEKKEYVFWKDYFGNQEPMLSIGKFNWENFGGDVLLLRERK